MPGRTSVAIFARWTTAATASIHSGVGVGAESVDAARSPEPDAVCDLDRVHPGGVQRGGDFGGLRQAVLMPYRVHPVTQRDVTEVKRLGHLGTPTVRVEWAAMRSAVASAAEVMMSRFPA